MTIFLPLYVEVGIQSASLSSPLSSKSAAGRILKIYFFHKHPSLVPTLYHPDWKSFVEETSTLLFFIYNLPFQQFKMQSPKDFSEF